MKIIKDYKDAAELRKGSVLTIGNFDGVHLGHRAIIEETKNIAATMNLPSLVVTFDPHPILFLKPDIRPFYITSLAQKAALIEELGVDFLAIIKFDAEFSKITAEKFVEEILVGALNTRHIVIGHDFNFGYKREGNSQYLRKAAEKYGFGFTQVATKKSDDKPFSSTLIRTYLKEGKIVEAEMLLGHPFAISGQVLHGDKNGRMLGFPTANLDIKNYTEIKFGVYETKAQILPHGKWHKSIANIGIRPTIAGTDARLEVHILDFAEDIYGREITVEFKNFIREEMKFPGREKLQEQIAKDIEKITK